MKKLILAQCCFSKVGLLLCLCFAFQFSQAQGVWTWMGGSSVRNNTGVFGTQGVPSVNNTPPGMYSPLCWTDLQGNFWLFGGQNGAGAYADMWTFNPETLEWTWMNGPGHINVYPVYGQKGVAASSNAPGCRVFSGCTWVDVSGDLWLYTGQNWNSGGLSDVWKYHIATNEWTWMSGDTLINLSPVYGTLGVPSISNTPGNRTEISNPWVDNNGKFWLYGGVDHVGRTYSDMWMYDPVTNMWTWESGNKGLAVNAAFGDKEVFSASNTPGGRRPYTMITETDGNFLLFGGRDNSYNADDDLWEYNPTINEWRWISGSQTVNSSASYGGLCQGDTAFYPDARYENRDVWKDCAGNMWMYGGANDLNGQEIFGDMWVYLTASKEWARMSNSGYINASPDFGTLGVPSLSNQPGGKYGAGHWKDNKGNFWIYGAYLFPGDLWRYVPDSTCSLISCTCLITGNFNYVISDQQVTFNSSGSSAITTNYFWDFGDNTTGSVANPVHNYITNDTFHVCLTVFDNDICAFTQCKDIDLRDVATGVSGVSTFTSIRLYPNPANNELTIEALNGNTPKQITITDDLGQTLIHLNTDKTKTQIDFHQLAAGIYFVKTQLADGSVAVNKLVKE